jgi:hypothetical protein
MQIKKSHSQGNSAALVQVEPWDGGVELRARAAGIDKAVQPELLREAVPAQ